MFQDLTLSFLRWDALGKPLKMNLSFPVCEHMKEQLGGRRGRQGKKGRQCLGAHQADKEAGD